VATVLVIHAHPDDEVFANAGRLAALTAEGHRVVGVIATGGEAGELHATGDPSEALIRRLQKYEHALDRLGASSWQWLEPGAEWVDLPSGPHVADADPGRLRAAVDRLLTEHDPHAVLTVGADGLTRHPDHIAVGRAVRAAVRDRSLDGGAWGARLRRADVDAGAELARRFAAGRPIGSGRVRGTSAELAVFDVTAQTATRRAALDAYADGLGTRTLGELIGAADRIGDSLLLRAVFDAGDWRTENYERLDAAR